MLTGLHHLDHTRSPHATHKSTNKEKQSRKRRKIRKGVEDEELEAKGVQYEAEQF